MRQRKRRRRKIKEKFYKYFELNTITVFEFE
jgi:hypothetical protein